MAFAQSILIICENEERHDDSTSDVSDCDHNPSEIIKAERYKGSHQIKKY